MDAGSWIDDFYSSLADLWLYAGCFNQRELAFEDLEVFNGDILEGLSC